MGGGAGISCIYGSEVQQLGMPAIWTHNSHLQIHLPMIIFCFAPVTEENLVLNPAHNLVTKSISPICLTFQVSRLVASRVETHTTRPTNMPDGGKIV